MDSALLVYPDSVYFTHKLAGLFRENLPILIKITLHGL